MSDKEMRIKIKVDNTEVKSAFKQMSNAQNQLSKSVMGSSKGMGQAFQQTASGATGLMGKLGGLGKAWASVNTGFGTFTAGLTPLTAGLAVVGKGVKAAGALAKESIMDYSKFEGTLKQVQIIAGGTQADMDLLGKTAIEVGGNTSKGAQEMADAMVDFAKLGFTAKETSEAMTGIVYAAEASGSAVDTTAQIVATALNVWNMKASDAEKIADILSKTSNETAADMTDLGYTLQYAGSSASLAGASIEELAAMAGIMADRGIKGSKAGTSLRTAFTNLIAPTDKAAAAMDNLGVAWADSEGKARPTMDVIRDLQNAVQGMSDIEIQDLSTKLFGKTGAAGMSFVLKTTSKEMDQLVTSLENSTGTASRQAAEMRETMEGQLDQLGDSWDAIKLKIGKGLVDGGGLQVVKSFNGMLDGISKGIDDFSSSYDRTKKLLNDSGGLIGNYQDAKKYADALTSVGNGLNTIPFNKAMGGFRDMNGVTLEAQALAANFNKTVKEFNFLPEGWEEDLALIGTTLSESFTSVELEMAKVTASVGAGGKGDFSGKINQTIENNIPALQSALQQQTDVFDKSNESRLTALSNFFAQTDSITSENGAAALASETARGEQQRSTIESNNAKIIELYRSLGTQEASEREVTHQKILNLQNANDSILRQNAQAQSDSIIEVLRAQASTSGTITQEMATKAITDANKQYTETVAAAQKTYTESVAAINSMSNESVSKTGQTRDQLIENARSQMTGTIDHASKMRDGVVEKVQDMADKSEEVDGTHIQINAEADTSNAMEQLGQLAATINNVIGAFNNTVGKIQGGIDSFENKLKQGDQWIADHLGFGKTKKKARGGLTSGVGYGIGGGATYSPNATAVGSGNQLGQAGLGGGVISNERGREVTMPVQNATYMRPFAAAVAREMQTMDSGLSSGIPEIIVPVYLNSKEFARATNKDMSEAQARTQRISNRAIGKK